MSGWTSQPRPTAFATRYVVAPSGCWIWQGATSDQGYGHTKAYSRWMTAQRAFYIFYVGSIPDGWEIDHLCWRRNCVNPLHLEAVTRRTNIRRSNGLAGTRSRQTHCIHGHAFTPENTAWQRNGTRRCRACGRRKDREYYARTRARLSRAS